jgi:hypothetical protein
VSEGGLDVKRMLLFLIFILLVASCVPSTLIKKGKISKPTMSTKPFSYLDSFPLGEVIKLELYINLGVPDRKSGSHGNIYYSYELGKGDRKREYMYVIKNDIIVDVIYKDQGPYSGSSARDRQKKVIKGTALKIKN